VKKFRDEIQQAIAPLFETARRDGHNRAAQMAIVEEIVSSVVCSAILEVGPLCDEPVGAFIVLRAACDVGARRAYEVLNAAMQGRQG
jgi:hypothetical protein